MSEMNYYIDSNKSIIFSKYNGSCPAENIFKHIKIIWEDSEFHIGLNAVIDFSEANIPPGYLNANSVIKFFKANISYYKNMKIAFIVGKQSEAGVGVFESALEFSNLQVYSKSFSESHEAQEWAEVSL